MASCEKENLNINYTDKSSSFQSLKNTGTTTQASFREYYNLVGGCIPVVENCHPNDIVITGGGSSLSGLDAAIAISSLEVANNFSNGNTAVSLIPEWNASYFQNYKTAILSGNYTFVKQTNNNNIVYFLGKDGQVSSSNYEYVIVYK